MEQRRAFASILPTLLCGESLRACPFSSLNIFNVLSDFASFPVAYAHQSSFIHGLQRKVGLWADELILEAKKPEFSRYKYIGEETMNTAFFLESLIKNETTK